MQIPEATAGAMLPGRSIEELKSRNDPEAIKAVSKEMESLFAYEMIKAMRETTTMGKKGGLGASTYLSMFDMELSKLFAKRGLGIQEMLVKGLESRAQAKKPDQEVAATQKPDLNSAPESVRKIVGMGQGVVSPAQETVVQKQYYKEGNGESGPVLGKK
jgi:Rod binding domain-containing protein